MCGALLRAPCFLLQRNVTGEAALGILPCGPHVLKEAGGSCQSCFSLMSALYSLSGLGQHAICIECPALVNSDFCSGLRSHGGLCEVATLPSAVTHAALASEVPLVFT